MNARQRRTMRRGMAKARAQWLLMCRRLGGVTYGWEVWQVFYGGRLNRRMLERARA